MFVCCVHQFLFMLPAPFCSTLLSLQLSKKSDKNIYNEREKIMKLWRNSCLVFFLFCLSAFLFFGRFFLPFVVFFVVVVYFFLSFFVFYLYLRELSPMMSNKQTNKKKSNHISEHCTVSERFFGDGMRELSSKTVG